MIRKKMTVTSNNDDYDGDDRQWQAAGCAGFAQTSDLLLCCSHHLPDRFQPVICVTTDQVSTKPKQNIIVRGISLVLWYLWRIWLISVETH